jgi:SAM-dependent methyltransferase
MIDSLRFFRLKFLCWFRRNFSRGFDYGVDYADSLSKGWSKEQWFEDINKLVQKAIARFEGKTVLCAGCGNGEEMQLIKEKGFSVSGFEISKESVKRCKEKGLTVWEQDLEEFKEEGVADTVYCSNVIEHLKDDFGGIKKLLKASKKTVVIALPEKIFTEGHLHYHLQKDIFKLIKRLQKEKLIEGYSIEYLKELHLPTFLISLKKANWDSQKKHSFLLPFASVLVGFPALVFGGVSLEPGNVSNVSVISFFLGIGLVGYGSIRLFLNTTEGFE